MFWGGERELIGPPAVHADNAQKPDEFPDEHLANAMPVAKKIALAVGAVDDNVLQMRVAHAAGCAVAHCTRGGIHTRHVFSFRRAL